MDQDMMDTLGQMFAVNAQRRADRATAFLDMLTDDERDLVRRGAFHGYAAGWTFGAVNPDIFRDVPYPGDADILDAAVASMREPLDQDQLKQDSERSYWLFREAAVMGFVLGDRSGGVDQRAGRPFTPSTPEHTAVFVVEHCQSTSDTFPILGNDGGELAWKILRGKRGPLPRAPLASAVRYFLPYVTAEQVDDIVQDYLDDDRLVETDAGLAIKEQS